MSVTSTTSTSSSSTSSAITSATSKATLDMNSFIRLLTVQLSNQNPLEPMNDRDFFAQMAQLGQVQGMEQLQKSADMQQAQSLMGKSVTATRESSETTSGTVEVVDGVVKKISMRNGEYYLGIQEADGGIVDVKMKNISAVTSSDSVGDASYLIGKNVGGTGYLASDADQNSIAVIGKVIGISNEGGKVLLQVETSSGTATLPLSNLDQVAE